MARKPRRITYSLQITDRVSTSDAPAMVLEKGAPPPQPTPTDTSTYAETY